MHLTEIPAACQFATAFMKAVAPIYFTMRNSRKVVLGLSDRRNSWRLIQKLYRASLQGETI